MLDKYVRVMQDKYEDSEITSEIGSESLLKKYYAYFNVYTFKIQTRNNYKNYNALVYYIDRCFFAVFILYYCRLACL